MITGRVKKFDDNKGIGEIISENNETIFVHFSAVQSAGYRSLQAGQKVDFAIANGFRGPQAVNLTVVTD
ncbi:cold-shock protein [Bombilactobacillus bombi]|uniref:cold-shock protein n=1 Tax=Bombilactobacillus bombi TaxID=1303590 RepID=UPI0015E5F3C2|nr:cold shock domain-containing protein [Bombilactobacillus bombi]MBA1434346.1 cold-shock protein [Bombilactobacillus bombi]